MPKLAFGRPQCRDFCVADEIVQPRVGEDLFCHGLKTTYSKCLAAGNPDAKRVVPQSPLDVEKYGFIFTLQPNVEAVDDPAVAFLAFCDQG